MTAGSPRRPDAKRKRVGLVSLGCPKNQVDAELMLGRLEAAGYEITADAGQADAIIVNTCAFIDAAKEESIAAIFDAAQSLEEREGGRLIVTGCLAQRYAGELASEMPEVAAFVPLGEVALVQAAIEGASPRLAHFPAPYEATFLDDASAPRRLTTSAGSAYLKISEGCDHTCSFCAIPAMRGRHRSRSIEDVVREAEGLAARGVREVVLVSQDSSAYGSDRGLRHGLARLLEGLEAVPRLEWVRVMYAYPNTLDDATLDAMGSLSRTCRYLDMPLQHASRRILAAMRRGGSARSLSTLLQRVRDRVPGVVLRTTFIVGFPGEEDADFAELLGFVRDTEFDHLGVFTYSAQEGTGASSLEDSVAPSIKERRRDELMAAQSEISLRRNRERVGQVLEVLVEGVHPESEHLLAGRWRGQAPEIDGSVIITEGLAAPGAVTSFLVEEAHEYDLVGRLVTQDDAVASSRP